MIITLRRLSIALEQSHDLNEIPMTSCTQSMICDSIGKREDERGSHGLPCNLVDGREFQIGRTDDSNIFTDRFPAVMTGHLIPFSIFLVWIACSTSWVS